jgi:hypothetical protein
MTLTMTLSQRAALRTDHPRRALKSTQNSMGKRSHFHIGFSISFISASKRLGTSPAPSADTQLIEVPEKGRAVQMGRFNQGGQMEIFDQPYTG